MPALPLLSSPSSYRPCIQNLLHDETARAYWLKLFENHAQTLADLPVAGARLRDQPVWEALHRGYLAGLSQLRDRPDARGELTVLELTKFRDEQLTAHGVPDPFAELKARENAVAMREFVEVLADVDRCDAARRSEQLVRGLFAGNLFDMGSKAAVDAFAARDHGFLEARSRVAQRPWAIDDFDRWRDRIEDASRPYRKAMFFVDNAGPDIVLGVFPFARWLALRGTRVILAANSRPSLNDVTAEELIALLDRASDCDAQFLEQCRSRTIRVVASGCASPLIDLRDLTDECCEEARDCDLLILEGMGRAIESNFDAEFNVDTIKLALIKDPMVASTIATRMFDPVFRFQPAE